MSFPSEEIRNIKTISVANPHWLVKYNISTQFMMEHKSFLIYLTSPGKILQPASDKPLTMLYKEGDVFVISYKCYNITRLRHPYKSDCKDYTRQGFQSKAHAVALCRNHFSSQLLNLTTPGTVVILERSLNTTYLGLTIERSNHRAKYVSIAKECRKKYSSLDCNEEMYVTELVSRHTGRNYGSNILVVLPKEPTIGSVKEPNLSFDEYAILFCSTLGYYFAFTVITTADKLV